MAQPLNYGVHIASGWSDVARPTSFIGEFGLASSDWFGSGNTSTSVCVCVCVCVCVRACVHVCVYVFLHAYIRVCAKHTYQS